jgi:hypothetical protein
MAVAHVNCGTCDIELIMHLDDHESSVGVMVFFSCNFFRAKDDLQQVKSISTLIRSIVKGIMDSFSFLLKTLKERGKLCVEFFY